MTMLEIGDWYFTVDAGRAWSTAAGGWVADWPAERATALPDLAALDRALRALGMRSPVIGADDVRAEASRRMQMLVGARDAAHLEIVIANGTREAVRLLRLKGERDWTADEAMRAALLEQLDAAIEAIRAASNAMEESPPADYAADAHWPAIGGGA